MVDKDQLIKDLEELQKMKWQISDQRRTLIDNKNLFSIEADLSQVMN